MYAGSSWFDSVSVPCSRLGMAVFGSIALAFRVKMVGSEGGREEKRERDKTEISMLSSMQSQSGEQPYVSVAANTSCLLFFLFALLNPLHVQYEISVRAETRSNLACSPHSLPPFPGCSGVSGFPTPPARRLAPS